MNPPSAVASPEGLTRGLGPIVAVCTANLLAYFAIGVSMPVLPLYMRQSLGSNDFSVGIVMASYAVTTLFGRLVGGRWGDRRGYAAPAMSGAACLVVGTASYGLIPSALWLLACRLVVGCGEGMSQACCVAWAVSLVSPRQRGAVLSYAGVTGWGGVGLGAIAGDAALGRIGFSQTFWLGGLAPLTALALLVAVRSSSPRRDGRSPPVPLMRLGLRFLRHGAAYALVTVGYAGVLTFGTLLMRARHASMPSLLLNAFVCGVIAVRLVAADAPARLGPARAAAFCAALQAVGLWGVAQSWLPDWAVGSAGALAGLAFGLSFPALGLDALGSVSELERGVAIGVVSAFFDVGMALSGPVLGWTAERGGYPMTFLASAACALIAAALAWSGRRRPRDAAP